MASKWKKFVVHCKKAKYDTYIGRPSVWGNPFVIGKDGSRAEVIAKFRVWFYTQPELLKKAKDELFGHVLGCWCGKEEDCHGDIIAEVANAED